MPNCYIIAGPNGAGKTTFAEVYLPNEGDCIHFVNADLIAKGISPFDPKLGSIAAGRILLERVNDLVGRREDFAFETTLSGEGMKERIKNWKDQGYRIKLIFLKLPNVETAKARVRNRVSEGGHNVLTATIERRFERGLRQIDNYKKIVDEWVIYDNSGTKPVLIDHEKYDSEK